MLGTKILSMAESQQASNMLNSFDFTTIDEMDPSLADGHKLVYDRELPFHIRFEDRNYEAQELSTEEPLRVRLFLFGEEARPQNIRIEVSSENDLFFHYTHIYAAVFTIYNEGNGKCSIYQTTEYKNIELISFDFNNSGEESVRQQITYRYGSLKSKLALMEGRLHDINELLRVKNPSLLLQLQKGSQALNKSIRK